MLLHILPLVERSLATRSCVATWSVTNPYAIQMSRSWIVVGSAFVVVAAMISPDWIFPWELFYTPDPPPKEVSRMLLFKGTIELSLFLLLLSLVAISFLWGLKLQKNITHADIGPG